MIHEILAAGEQNAIPAKTICARLQIDARTFTARVEAERRQGWAICATSNPINPGYYLAQDKDAMRAYCGKLRHRAGEIYKTHDACYKTIEQLPEREPEPNEQMLIEGF